MNLLMAAALLGLGVPAARPAADSWPAQSCLHGATINDSGRPLDLRGLDGTIRLVLQDAGATISAPHCRTYINVLIAAEPLIRLTSRLTAHLVIADREVSPEEVGRHAAAFTCGRMVTEVVRMQEDLFLTAQAAVTGLLSQPPHCPSGEALSQEGGQID